MVQFSEDPTNTTPAPDDQSTDVTKSVTKYSEHRVSVKVKYDNLTGGALQGAFADIKTNKKRYTLSVFKNPSTGSEFVLEDKGGDTIKCTGKNKKFSSARDVIKMSVPRSCLGNPRWVRVALIALSVQESGTLADDALRVGLKSSGNLTFGPKLKRG